jgi:hypothetical protein
MEDGMVRQEESYRFNKFYRSRKQEPESRASVPAMIGPDH